MITIKFNTQQKEDFAKIAKQIELDVQKSVNWYINQVYRELSKQHGRNYTYITPPGNKRTNVRKRSGKLLRDLKQSKYVRQVGQYDWEAGFNIDRGSYLYRFHVGERGDPAGVFRHLDVPASQRFDGRVLIPLRAALNANGTMKPITARHQLQQVPFHKMVNWKSADFSGEDKSKFHDNSIILFKQMGSKRIPMFILAKNFKVPKRVFVREKLNKYYNALYDRLDLEIERALNRKYAK